MLWIKAVTDKVCPWRQPTPSNTLFPSIPFHVWYDGIPQYHSWLQRALNTLHRTYWNSLCLRHLFYKTETTWIYQSGIKKGKLNSFGSMFHPQEAFVKVVLKQLSLGKKHHRITHIEEKGVQVSSSRHSHRRLEQLCPFWWTETLWRELHRCETFLRDPCSLHWRGVLVVPGCHTWYKGFRGGIHVDQQLLPSWSTAVSYSQWKPLIPSVTSWHSWMPEWDHSSSPSNQWLPHPSQLSCSSCKKPYLFPSHWGCPNTPRTQLKSKNLGKHNVLAHNSYKNHK